MPNTVASYVNSYRTAMSQGNVAAAQTYAQLAVEALIDAEYTAAAQPAAVLAA